MADADALRELIEISLGVGGDEDIVQAGGGNTSVKTADRSMLIKASGTSLSAMTPDTGWVELDLARIINLFDDPDLRKIPEDDREAAVAERLSSARIGGPGERPSVESLLHALLGRVVIHTHPVSVAVFACSDGGEEKLGELLGEKLLWVPYCDPGVPLAFDLFRRLDEYRRAHDGADPSCVIQQNHGLFVHGQTAQTALAEHAAVIERCSAGLTEPGLEPRELRSERIREIATVLRRAHGRIFNQGAERIECHTAPLVKAVRKPALAAAAFDEDAARGLTGGALSPDHVVYCGPAAMLVPEDTGADGIEGLARRHHERHGVFPKVVVAEGSGVFLTGSTPSQLDAAESTAAAFARVLRAQRELHLQTRYMPQRDVDYIMNWEAEHYRAKMLTSAAQRPLEGRVALVTGAGSGLGRSIALGLVKAGAFVFFADIDRESAESAAAEGNTGGRECAFVLEMDVTDEAQVASAFDQLVSRAGGIDIIVNCAGIAPSFSLIDFPLDQWRKALDINLTGYFLVTREATRIMKQQGIGGSIICLTSKTGLDASKSNSAYNATKAGEIHLARGWALELADDLIRVNCVAPGNVFEGSKIWNPEYIRRAAEKKGIKPEEVIPYYVSLSPLKMEIKGQDVADAVVFLCSDAARRITGQILVVDGGQVMVR